MVDFINQVVTAVEVQLVWILGSGIEEGNMEILLEHVLHPRCHCGFVEKQVLLVAYSVLFDEKQDHLIQVFPVSEKK